PHAPLTAPHTPLPWSRDHDLGLGNHLLCDHFRRQLHCSTQAPSQRVGNLARPDFPAFQSTKGRALARTTNRHCSLSQSRKWVIESLSRSLRWTSGRSHSPASKALMVAVSSSRRQWSVATSAPRVVWIPSAAHRLKLSGVSGSPVRSLTNNA